MVLVTEREQLECLRCQFRGVGRAFRHGAAEVGNNVAFAEEHADLEAALGDIEHG